jgi:hypothetical protein
MTHKLALLLRFSSKPHSQALPFCKLQILEDEDLKDTAIDRAPVTVSARDLP